MEDRLVSARHDGIDLTQRGAECRRALRGFEHTETTTRTRADIENAPPRGERRCQFGSALTNPCRFAAHRFDRTMVFLRHRVEDRALRSSVQVAAEGVDGFGWKRFPLRAIGHEAQPRKVPRFVVFEGLMDLFARVHDKRTVAGHGLVEGLGGEQ